MTITSNTDFVFRTEHGQITATCIHCLRAKEVQSTYRAWCGCEHGDATARTRAASAYQLRMLVAHLTGRLEACTGETDAEILADAWASLIKHKVVSDD